MVDPTPSIEEEKGRHEKSPNVKSPNEKSPTVEKSLKSSKIGPDSPPQADAIENIALESGQRG